MAEKDGKSSKPLEQLIYEACLLLQEHGYCSETIRHYRQTWQCFMLFSRRRGVEHFEPETVTEFMDLKEGPPPMRRKLAPRTIYMRRRHMLTLSDFNLHGCFSWQYSYTKGERVLSTYFDSLLTGYERFRKEQGCLNLRSVRDKRYFAKSFLFFVQLRGLKSVGQIDAELIDDYFKANSSKTTKSLSSMAWRLRDLFRYLSMKGLVRPALIGLVPQIRVYSATRVPEVWAKEDIERLLDAIDRSSASGKRDYAILLLAARLGMRPGDIKNLKLDNLKWAECKIDIIQEKTGRRLELPLSEEIGSAIIEYLKDGRPQNQHRNVFLTHRAPFSPFGANDSFHHIITKRRQVAGIKIKAQSSKGLYTLRHSIATHLLEASTPLETISAIMGHITSDVTLVYAKADVVSLRQVALELEKDGGKCI